MPQYRISKIIDAPPSFVYKWCTDFRADDPKILGASYTRHIVDKTKKRAVWIQHYTRDGVEMEGVRYVTLFPPDSWHMESVNEDADRIGDYHLTPLGKKTNSQSLSRQGSRQSNQNQLRNCATVCQMTGKNTGLNLRRITARQLSGILIPLSSPRF